MRFTKLTAMAALTLSALLSMANMVFADQAQFAAGGANCKAANLNQATQLRWDQFGVFNPSTTPYFVVCALQRDQPALLTENLASGATIGAMITGVFDPGAGGPISCTWRVTDANLATNTLSFNGFAQTINDPTPGGAARRVANANINLTTDNPARNDLWSTVVCALPPNTGIARVGLLFK